MNSVVCHLFRAHQTRRSGQLLRLGFNEVAQFLSKSEVSVALVSLFKSVFFSPIIILFLQYSHKMFLKCDPYRVWCSIFYSKLVNCILLRSLFVFVKGRGTCGSGERNVNIWIDFRKSPRSSLTSPLSQEREKSSHPVFTMCDEPCCWNMHMHFLSFTCQFSDAIWKNRRI